MITGWDLWERWKRAEPTTSLAVLVTALVVAACGLVTVVARGPSAAPDATAAIGTTDAATVAGRPQDRSGDRSPAVRAVGRPLRVRIPAIGVDAPLVPLGLNDDGTLEVPRYEEAGWYAGGTRPGDVGPAVIAAHLDSTTGPAVFHRLEDLRVGNTVHVEYRDVTVTFSVEESRSYDKSRFPTRRVYGPTESPELRLITCDGSFDRATRSYDANLVVWASLASAARAA